MTTPSSSASALFRTLLSSSRLGGISGAGPTLYATNGLYDGSSVNGTLTAQGATGGWVFDNWFGPLFQVVAAPNEVPYNFLQFLARSSGNPPSIFFSGADTNVNGYLSAQGSGIIYVANSSGPIGANSAPIGQFGNSSGSACTDQFRFIGQASGSNYNIQISGLAGGDVSIGSTADGGTSLATNVTKGFLRIPHMAGVPSGTPAITDNFTPIVYDTSDDLLYAYNTAWKAIPTYIDTGTVVNTIQFKREATGVSPILNVTGTDTNVGLWIQTKGIGSVLMLDGSGSLASFNSPGARDH